MNAPVLSGPQGTSPISATCFAGFTCESAKVVGVLEVEVAECAG